MSNEYRDKDDFVKEVVSAVGNKRAIVRGEIGRRYPRSGGDSYDFRATATFPDESVGVSGSRELVYLDYCLIKHETADVDADLKQFVKGSLDEIAAAIGRRDSSLQIRRGEGVLVVFDENWDVPAFDGVRNI
ncbi:MAG: hypothetical protein ABIG28_02180 [archaeon]